MKIADNSLVAVKRYFHDQLHAQYNEREIRRFYEWTVLHHFGWSTHDLIVDKDKRLTESQLLKVISVVKGLKKEIPIQYLLGRAHFFGLDIEVSGAVLIPRPETEELVDWIVKTVAGRLVRILDIGTGSGCIALALKSSLPVTSVTGVDVSEEALKMAGNNAKRLGLDVSFEMKNVLDTAENWEKGYDLIVSNPPYIRRSESSLMKPNVIENEPHLALFVPDDDPLIFYDRIAVIALKVLNKQGWLFFEINEVLGEKVKELLFRKGFGSVELRKDLNGKHRMIRCQI